VRVEIVEYNQEWPDLFLAEQCLLLAKLPGVQIEHIGSTAVPGLGAKPVIDLLIGVKDFLHSAEFVPIFLDLGYEYFEHYEEVMPFRRFFCKNFRGVRTHNVHLVKIGSEFWLRHLAFRDYLRQNELVRNEYYLLKKSLAEQDWETGNDYAQAKTNFIREVEKKILDV